MRRKLFPRRDFLNGWGKVVDERVGIAQEMYGWTGGKECKIAVGTYGRT